MALSLRCVEDVRDLPPARRQHRTTTRSFPLTLSSLSRFAPCGRYRPQAPAPHTNRNRTRWSAPRKSGFATLGTLRRFTPRTQPLGVSLRNYFAVGVRKAEYATCAPARFGCPPVEGRWHGPPRSCPALLRTLSHNLLEVSMLFLPPLLATVCHISVGHPVVFVGYLN